MEWSFDHKSRIGASIGCGWWDSLAAHANHSATRERKNRQINERLRTLIAASKVLGASLAGELSVDPAHLRSFLKAVPSDVLTIEASDTGEGIVSGTEAASSERRRRIRDVIVQRKTTVVAQALGLVS